jgi:anthranilate phosphoribosyltransferase
VAGMKTKSFAEIIQKKIDKENKRREKSRGLLASIMAQNANGIKTGPILLSSLVSKKSNQ